MGKLFSIEKTCFEGACFGFIYDFMLIDFWSAVWAADNTNTEAQVKSIKISPTLHYHGLACSYVV